MTSLAITRLAEERRQWRKDHPFGFYAKPEMGTDGTMNLLSWKCGVPGKQGSIWEGGVYTLKITFSTSYPSTAPKVQFVPKIPHPNIYPSGFVCLSLLSCWKASTTLKQILLGVQQLLDEPNPNSPANHDMYVLYTKNRDAYDKRVKSFAASMIPK